MNKLTITCLLLAAMLCVACGRSSSEAGPGAAPASAGGRGGPPGGMPWGGGAGPGAVAAVPVEVVPVMRRAISSFIETNGTLEAENEVNIVARTTGPIVELRVEEGDLVRRGQTLAKLDDLEDRAQLEIARVELHETELAFERARTLQQESLISPEEYEQAVSAYDSAKAQYEAAEIQLGYTQITAPFDGLIIARYVKFAEQVSSGTALFRISDFDPLLCPIQVPERELPELRLGQRAYLTVEPWPDERFEARVLRISPVVDAATGTIKVTLETRPQGKLRPGMFARVFVETATRSDALVVPKAALSLESIGDTVYVAAGDVASRREVELGFSEGDWVEVLSGVQEGEPVVVVGQDGLSDGTPIQVLQSGQGAPAPAAARRVSAGEQGPPGASGGPRGKRPFDPSNMTPEQLERAKEFMRARGMSEEQIEQRLQRARERAASETPTETR